MADLNINAFGLHSSKILNSASETVFQPDFATGAFIVIDVNAINVNEGLFFEASVTTTLTAGATFDIVFTTPASEFIHFTPAIVSTSADDVSIDLYENCSVSSGATVMVYNHNRIATSVSTVTVVQSASVTADGTLIHPAFLGGNGGMGQATNSAESNINNKWILKQSTNYCLRLTNSSTGTNKVTVNQLWSEQVR